MSWGAWGKKYSTQEQTDLIHFCVENGNTIFDHADIYGDYTTEAEFGNALAQSGIRREEVKLITKCGIQNMGVTRPNKVKHYNYSKDYIIWSAEESLRNLKTDYLDTFLLHRPSPLMQPYEIAEAIHHLQQTGKIVTFGVSNFTPSQVDLILDLIPISTNQIEFSLTQHTAIHNGSLDQMLRKQIQPMSWSPLGSVFKLENEQTTRIKKAVKSLATKYGVSEDVLLLSWVLKHPSGVSPVIGTTNKSRIQNANKALETELELEDWFMLLTESQGHDVP
ncbi:MAG: hypothetical protein RLZZ337_8 [Bacteroidota bacterium]